MAKEHKSGLVELPREPRRFQVKLKDCPQVEFEAADAHEAEQKYRKHCGIIQTLNRFEIGEVQYGETPGEAVPAQHAGVPGK